MIDPEQTLRAAEAVHAACEQYDRDEHDARLARRIERIDRKIAQGHEGLEPFRERLLAKLATGDANGLAA